MSVLEEMSKKKSGHIFALMLVLTLCLLSANLSNSKRLTFKVGKQQSGTGNGNESPYFAMLPRGPVPPSGPNQDPRPPFSLLHKDGFSYIPPSNSHANNVLT